MARVGQLRELGWRLDWSVPPTLGALTCPVGSPSPLSVPAGGSFQALLLRSIMAATHSLLVSRINCNNMTVMSGGWVLGWVPHPLLFRGSREIQDSSLVTSPPHPLSQSTAYYLSGVQSTPQILPHLGDCGHL